MRTAAIVVVAAAGCALGQAASYAPVYGACPDTSQLLRLANNGTIGQQEAAYIDARLATIASNWTTYAQKAGYTLTAPPKTAIAVSGGGYRAALFGAGVLSAFDALNTSSPVAGVLQNMVYLAGLSGGSWLTGSYALNNAAPGGFFDLVFNSPDWELDKDLLLPAGAAGLLTGENEDYFDQIKADVDLKSRVANTSITDYWGRALSYHFYAGSNSSNFFIRSSPDDHAAGLLWSSITQQTSFLSHQMPLPIVLATSRPPNLAAATRSMSDSYIPLSSINYEFTPYEFGSFDPRLAAFTNISFLGSELQNGTPINSSSCAQAYDNAGFIIGTSSSLFNAILSTVNSTLSSADATIIEAIFSQIDGGVRRDTDDVSNIPNSFRGLMPSNFQDSASYQLQLTDGGEDGQNVPLVPLLQPSRAIDAIIAVDASADTTSNYANGTSLLATAAKVAVLNGSLPYPPVPATQSDFLGANGYARPWFFGCNTTLNGTDNYPIIVYLPNQPAQGFTTNTSTFKLDYTDDEALSLMGGAHALAVNGLGSDWPVCLACALSERQRQRDGLARSSACANCFSSYCYMGPTASSTPTVVSSAGPASPASSSSSAASSRGPSIVVLILGLFLLTIV